MAEENTAKFISFLLASYPIPVLAMFSSFCLEQTRAKNQTKEKTFSCVILRKKTSQETVSSLPLKLPSEEKLSTSSFSVNEKWNLF